MSSVRRAELDTSNVAADTELSSRPTNYCHVR